MHRTTHREVVVIGGGQAGLALGRQLGRQGRDFTILEAASEPAAAWRARWDSLRLFTPAAHDALPGLPFPADPGHHPARDEVVAYLAEYARRFELPVELDSRVEAVRRAGDGYRVELAGRAIEARQVVVATGPFQVPRVPAFAAALGPGIVQLHSAAYRRPADLPAGRVLVVGGGNTGHQIAEELVRTREVHLALGARLVPLPQTLFGRDLFWYLTKSGLMGTTRDSWHGRRMRDREFLVGSSRRAARRMGIHLHGHATGASGTTVTFADGLALEVDAVLWATGFGRDHSWLDVPVLDAQGDLVHRRGVTPAEGLYVLGLPWLHTRGSALLGWVADDAAYLAGRIAAVARRRTPPALPAVA